MPIIKSSIKDVRRIKRRTARNSAEKNRIRTAIKAVRAAKTQEEAAAKLRLAMKALDKAASNGVLKRQTASRNIARLSSFVHKQFKSK
ncbi:MAG TPA: 30S ribosomal protein S20 [bacterium]|nr:30S ribosomal protein S20 [bacterium]